MLNKDAIVSALAAHAQWKKRLQDAIASGESTFTPETVKRDNVCDFGRWLYGLPAPENRSPDYLAVKDLHAEFHKTAGDILAKSLSGKRSEAQAMLDFGGTYGTIAGKLVLALHAWKDKL